MYISISLLSIPTVKWSLYRPIGPTLRKSAQQPLNSEPLLNEVTRSEINAYGPRASRYSASPVLMATGLVCGNWQISTPPPDRIDTPQPITKKLSLVINLVISTGYSCTKFSANPSTGRAASGKWVKYRHLPKIRIHFVVTLRC